MSSDRVQDDQKTMALVRAVQAGENERFQELYERLAPALFAWASLRIMPVMRSRLDPQDAVQEIWMRALAIFERFDPERSSFRAWLFRVAKNVMLEAFRHLRGGGGESAMGPTTKMFALERAPESITSFTTQLARDESIARFMEHVEELEPTDREILIHCGLEGLSGAEAAERLNLTREMVFKRWQRLRERLRERRLGEELVAVDS
ncbi:MAG: sigma-70 family RNA polymerase sigma factor [bacterium]|nr:sigma-70 family RNA polymerase sigma factor [bacterium]